MNDGPAIPEKPIGRSPAARPASDPRPVTLDMTSDPRQIADVRKAVEGFALAAGLERGAAELGLAVNEALANVIRHAYQGRTDQPISVSVDCDASQVTVRIRDWGNGVNPASRPPGEHDPCTPGGLGLICLRSLTDRIEFSPQPLGMLLTLSKRRP